MSGAVGGGIWRGHGAVEKGAAAGRSVLPAPEPGEGQWEGSERAFGGGMAQWKRVQLQGDQRCRLQSLGKVSGRSVTQ